MTQKPITFKVVGRLEDLTSRDKEIFDTESQFSLSYDWFANVIRNGLPPSVNPCLGVLVSGDKIAAIVPLTQQSISTVKSLTNCYSCLYHPLICRDAPRDETARLLGRELGLYCSGKALLQLDCIPSNWPPLGAFVAGIRATGLAVRQFHQFGNWYEPVIGRSWEEYLASRPGSLRELLRRRARQAQRNRLSFDIVSKEVDLPRGITAYQSVYERSWKPAEPFPCFIPELMRYAARRKLLRLGFCTDEGKPIAAQIWIVENGTATVHKLAHDEAARLRSPGTLLTAKMIEQLLSEGVREIDFGRGDDWYKRLWADHRRERIGLIVANLRRIQGIKVLTVHDIGRVTRRLRHSLSAYRAALQGPKAKARQR